MKSRKKIVNVLLKKKKRLKRILNCLVKIEHSFGFKKTEYTKNSVREEVSNRDAKHVRLTSRRACSGGVNEAKQSSPQGTGLYFCATVSILKKTKMATGHRTKRVCRF